MTMLANVASPPIAIDLLDECLGEPTLSRGGVLFGWTGDLIDQYVNGYLGLRWWLSKQGLVVAMVGPKDRPLSDFDRKAGEAPKENLFLFKLQCAADANDTPATVTALEDLIRLNGKPDYWNKLLRIERQEQKDDHSLLMIYRLMFDTNSMNAGSDYIEMAQLLGDAGLPGEAESVLEKGIGSGQIPQEQRERSARLLNAIKARAESDKKGLAQFAAEATKNPAGELDVKLGEVYYGFGDYQNAVKAIQAGLQKGQIKHLDEAYVYLGRAEAALKNGAEARKAFLGLKPLPGANAQLVKLFDLYGEKVG